MIPETLYPKGPWGTIPTSSKLYCRNGHMKITANAFYDHNGLRRCLICHRASAHLKPIEDKMIANRPNHKVCSKCQHEKPLDAFYQWRGGTKPYCKECDKAMSSAARRQRKAIAAMTNPDPDNPVAAAITLPHCAQCNTDKSPDAFGSDASQPTGRDTVCKACRAANSRAYRLRRSNETAAYQARRQARNPDGTPHKTARQMRIERMRSLNTSYTKEIEPPAFHFAVEPQGIVRYAQQFYRIVTLTETHVRLSNGQWVLRHLLTTA